MGRHKSPATNAIVQCVGATISFPPIDDEILWHDDGRATSLTLKVGDFFCTWAVTTLEGWGRNHYVWYR